MNLAVYCSAYKHAIWLWYLTKIVCHLLQTFKLFQQLKCCYLLFIGQCPCFIMTNSVWLIVFIFQSASHFNHTKTTNLMIVLTIGIVLIINYLCSINKIYLLIQQK